MLENAKIEGRWGIRVQKGPESVCTERLSLGDAIMEYKKRHATKSQLEASCHELWNSLSLWWLTHLQGALCGLSFRSASKRVWSLVPQKHGQSDKLEKNRKEIRVLPRCCFHKIFGPVPWSCHVSWMFLLVVLLRASRRKACPAASRLGIPRRFVAFIYSVSGN